MPWILKAFIRQHILALLLFFGALLSGVCGGYIVTILLVLAIFYIYFTILLYRTVLKKYKKPSEIFSPKSKVRNVKYLIIGDMYKPEEEVDYVQIAAPERTMESCYEILKHTHSILAEDNANVVIALKRHNVKKRGFSIFDLPFFHQITIIRLKCEGSLPVLSFRFAVLHPVLCLRFVLNIKSCNYKKSNISYADITEFCKERGYGVAFKVR